MWIVRLALRRPYTFVVASLLLLLLTPFVLMRTPTDIFPSINIPVVSVVWQYTGLTASDVEQRMVYTHERALTTTVNNIQHIESTSYDSIGVIKIFFQQGVSPDAGLAQVTAVSQTILKQLPPGTTPPLILEYNASTVPILQYGISSKALSEQQTFDLALNTIRVGLISVPGVGIPYPFGGKQRVISVDLSVKALEAQNLAQADVVNALTMQNLVYPSGTAKIGANEYPIDLNTSPGVIERLNDLPIKTVEGTVIRVRDVAQVRDGYMPQQNMVRQDGVRSTLLTVLKNGTASTLSVAAGVKAAMENVKNTLTGDVQIKQFGDQSLFVTAAVSGVVREGVIAATLTALMILLFLGSWRSTLIIAVSIPLSILASLVCLSALVETITIENINWHLEHGEDVEAAILNGAHEIAVPALVSTLAICIVFVPMFMLVGIARYLFVPMAEAVVFAMLASYLLSRTLVPTLAKYWLQRHDARAAGPPRGALQRLQRRFEQWFTQVRADYHALLERALASGSRFALPFLAAMAATALLAFPLGHYLPGLGQDFFPSVDAGQIKLHLRTPTGLRIDETATLCDRVEATIRQLIPAHEITTIVDNIGVPYSGINLAYSTSAPVGPGDADIFVNLSADHRPTAGYLRSLRHTLTSLYPSTTFAFLPADMVSQILNFGLPAPLDVQVSGFNVAANRGYANALLARMHGIPGVVDLRIQQAFDYPTLNVEVDRSKAALFGLSETDVASDLLVSLSGSSQTTLSFWIDPKSGTQYSIAAQTPQFRLASLLDLAATPVTSPAISVASGAGHRAQLLANLASFHRGVAPAVVSHYDATPVVDIFGAVEGTDLGFVSAQIDKLLADTQRSLPHGSQVTVRGQVKTMTESFAGLLLGLAAAIVLVYLLIVVNFQSWLDPFIIITALPAALGGIVWMLFLTHTPVSVPALTGAIMCMGVATANSVLVVSFARQRMDAGDDASHAALQAGVTRFRPVLMTALAMIIGMVPMALGIGEGGEQNAPLGRAVIGGLVFATVATLFFVPTVFTLIHGRRSR